MDDKDEAGHTAASACQEDTSAATITINASKAKTSILDKSIPKGKTEVHLTAYALLFSEIVQYCQNRSNSIAEFQDKLAELGRQVGVKMIDLIVFREENYKRETKLLNILLFVRSTVWKTLFGHEADKLEHSTDDQRQYYIIEKDPLVNHFISVPKDKSNLNCAAFNAGVVEGVLETTGFTAKVNAHWHKGATYYIIEFDDAVIARDKHLES